MTEGRGCVWFWGKCPTIPVFCRCRERIVARKLYSDSVCYNQAMMNLMTLKPIQIGSITIDTPLTLAPMAGQTNHAFRVICREKGDCGLVCTELLSSTAMHYNSRKTFQMCDWNASESPFAVQIFGSDPSVMADAARFVVDQGADIVDI